MIYGVNMVNVRFNFVDLSANLYLWRMPSLQNIPENILWLFIFIPTNWLLITAGLLLVLMFALYIRTTLRLRQNKQDIVRLDEENKSKDQIFAIISHDLRSAVSALQINLSKIYKSLPPDTKKEIIELTQNTELLGGSTLSLLNNLLYWSMTQTGQIKFYPQQHEVRPILQQVSYDYFPVAAAKEIEFKVDVFHDVMFFGDINSVKIILRNLIDNAIKFTPEKGIVLISAMPLDKQCLISVRDSGEGIDEQTIELLNSILPVISQKDTSGKRSTGLGLWLAKTMAIKNDGRLSITSFKNAGSSITLILPSHK